MRYELVVSAAVVAVFAAFWVITFAMSEPPEFQSQYGLSAIMVTVIALPWVLAVRLLWRACRVSGGCQTEPPRMFPCGEAVVATIFCSLVLVPYSTGDGYFTTRLLSCTL